MVDRIQLILKVHNLTASRFADEIGVQRSAISHILSGRNMPSLDLIQKILRRFPEINSDWLLNGAGIMNKNAPPDLFNNELTDIGNDKNYSRDGLEKLKNGNQNLSNSKDNSALSLNLPLSEMHENPTKTGKTIGKAVNVHGSISNPGSANDGGSQIQIEKVVIFYSNKTFREYFPE
jgi:transcriptional regulator with XRE-family HTH domain